ncbi:MAG: hypothetical protein CFH19_00639 [Alphaproteobacteria bacterium MarineAlpha5_Bin9]|nr:MAG: hypothetical protein CFH19_00639 [Alphaproteobacteria bacterium MarineAlpha5_Bin9]|tara:strand:- start:4987 stop:5394 length:408 start_codon:yes stop_codon:yes gene_type:complete
MKETLTALTLAFLIFLIIDGIWLSIAVKYIYRPYLGDIISDKPVIWAAVLFYLLFPIGLTLVVINPTMINGDIMKAMFLGAIFGLVAYGTYNLTNMATVKNWAYQIVIIDMIWGSLLTGITSGLTVFLIKLFYNN